MAQLLAVVRHRLARPRLPLVPRHRRRSSGSAPRSTSSRSTTTCGEPEREADRDEGVAGESWEIHGGGFYRIQKFRVAPPRLPKPLHWYKWEAYWTWLSGFALLCIVYYSDARLRLIDPAVADLEPWQAILISLALLAAAWLVYDLVCRLLADRPLVLVVLVLVGLVTATAYGVEQLYRRAPRTSRSARCSGRSWPRTSCSSSSPATGSSSARSRRAASRIRGRGSSAKQRSVHNNYLTLPVLFTMLAGHFSFTYGARPRLGRARRADGRRRRDPPLLQPAPCGRDALVDPGRVRLRDRRDRGLAAAARARSRRPEPRPCRSAQARQIVENALRALPLDGSDPARVQTRRPRASSSTRPSRSTRRRRRSRRSRSTRRSCRSATRPT